MTGIEIVNIGFGGANIALLVGLFWRIGRLSAQGEDHEKADQIRFDAAGERLTRLEAKI